MEPKIENGRPVYYVVGTLDIETNGIMFKQGEFHGLLSRAIDTKKGK